METIQKRHWLPGALLIVAGLSSAVLARIFSGSSYKVMVAAQISAIVFIAWGIASLLYLLEASVLRVAAPVLFLIGILVTVGGMINGSAPGIIAGGFLTVIGAVLMRKK